MPVFKNSVDTIKIRPMKKEDADTVAELYRSIAVTKNNYRDVFSDSDKSFSNHGGMFLISGSARILEILNDSTQTIIVGEYQNRICGMLWYGKWDRKAFPNLTLFPSFGEYGDIINEAEHLSQLAYAQEIISQPPEAAAAMSFALFYTMMSDFLSDGIKYAMGEVYRVDGYDDGTFHKCDLLNYPSYNLLLRSGGKHIGTTDVKNIETDCYCVHITPQIMLWDTAQSSKKIIDVLSSKGWNLLNS